MSLHAKIARWKNLDITQMFLGDLHDLRETIKEGWAQGEFNSIDRIEEWKALGYIEAIDAIFTKVEEYSQLPEEEETSGEDEY